MLNSTLPDYLYADELRTSGIYAVTCTMTGKAYIGSAVNLSLRWRKHYRELLKNGHHNLHLQRSWNKHGPHSLVFSVLEVTSVDSLIAREQHYLSACGPTTLFNLSPTAGSVLGFKQSPETCELMRQQRLGIQTHTEETKAKISARFKGVARRKPGWKMTDEQKDQIRLAHTGRPLSEAHKAQLAESCKGWNQTPEAKARISESKIKFTPEQVYSIRRTYVLMSRSLRALARKTGEDRRTLRRVVSGEYPYNYATPSA